MKNTTAIIDYYRQDLQSSFAILKQNVHDRRESLGAQDLDTLRSLSDLSVVARSLGEYQIARTLIELAIKDWPREDEAANLMMAAKMVFYRRIALVNRCVLQAESGDYASAEAGFQHLLQQPEFEDLQREVLLSLSSIAMMKDDYRTAQQYLLESEQLLLQDPYVRVDPQLDHALGVVHRELGDFDQARQYLEKALQHRRDNKFGPAYDLGDNLTSIGILEQKVGSLDKALQYYTEAAGNYIERLGPIGLRQADAARRVALAARLLGNNKLAVSAGERALQMKLQLSDSLAASLSEAETMLFANSLTELEPLLSGLSVDRDKNAAAALESVWRRKAIAARLIESRHHRLRDSDNLQSQPSLERLRIVRRELATLLGPQFSTTLLTGSSLGAIPPDHFDAQREERINELTSEKESLERTLARLAGSGGPSVASSVDDVIAAMPPETALIEFVKVNIWPTVSGKPASDKELKPEARFQLFVLVKDSSNRSQLSWHDLGPASEIDSLVEDVRSWIELESRRVRGVTVIRDHTKQQKYHLAYKRAGKKLTDTWASQIAKSRHLYLVPDGSLHGLPWAALPGHDSMYLIENASLSLLDRGPELIRRKTPDEVAGRLLMVGNLSYGERLDEAPQRLHWNSLQGTDQELRSIGRMVSERFTPTILQDAEANEDATTAAMKAASIVHFATHGFYTPDDSTAASTGSLNWRDPMLASAVGRNPLSRCGVVLANANQLPKLDADGIPYGNDGLLTGEELCDLDLRGVHLVVFSACETGLGRIADNEGTLGLHRAVSTAGAASMIGSLWQVSDDATTQLMTEFYRNWTVQDIGSAEALRRAQLEMLKGVGNDNSPQFTAPFYWAAFVVAGDPDVTP